MSKNVPKIIFVSSLVTFLILISVVFVMKFYINKLSDSILDLREDSYIIQNDDVTSLKFKLSKLSQSIEKIDNYFIDSNSVAGFLDKLDGVGVRSGGEFEIENVDLEEGNKSDKTDIKNLNIVTQNKGSWNNVITYLLSLKSLDKKVFVDSFRLSAVIDPETGNLSWNLITNLKGIAK